MMDRILKLIAAERDAQDVKWGDCSDHTQERWLAVLTGEVGEVARAILNGDLKGRHGVRDELIQVAAVAVAWLESLEPKLQKYRPPGCQGCCHLLTCESVEGCPF